MSYPQWTPARAARLGYLAGRGYSVESILADPEIQARSEGAVRKVASRWNIALGVGMPVSLHLPVEDRMRLHSAASDRSMTTTELARLILQTVLRDGLVRAVIDDE